uniref:Uncharacterized protein n=1 Tax=viral metagenome TaxID=1070528 RepID=A0A6C0BN76_9ZZZZ
MSTFLSVLTVCLLVYSLIAVIVTYKYNKRLGIASAVMLALAGVGIILSLLSGEFYKNDSQGEAKFKDTVGGLTATVAVITAALQTAALVQVYGDKPRKVNGG